MTDPVAAASTARPLGRGALAATGIVLIVAPILATVLKIAFPGWFLVIIVLTGTIVLLAAGFVVQIVIAATGFLSARAVFGGALGQPVAPGARRAVIASWVTSIALLLTVFFLPEGGDSSYGSIFAILVGAESNTAVNDVSSILFFIAGIVWVGGWVWLLVEWIRAIRARRRWWAAAAQASSPPAQPAVSPAA